MQIQITITPASLDEALDVLSRLGASTSVPAAAQTGKATRERKAKPEAAPAAEAATAEAAPGVDPGPLEDAKIVSETNAPAIDYDRDVRPVLAKAATDPAMLKRIVALLAKYGVKRGQDVPADRLQDFNADLAALVSPPQPVAAEPLL